MPKAEMIVQPYCPECHSPLIIKGIPKHFTCLNCKDDTKYKIPTIELEVMN